MKIDRTRFFADLETLAQFGASATGGVNRMGLSMSDVAARHWLANELASCGYDVVIDGAGNVYGRYPDVERSVLIGSHLDSVPNGGRLDGALGVVAAIATARAAIASAPRGVGIDVIAFSDEEGRFGDLLGSRLYVGDLQFSDASGFISSDGQSFASALCDAGLSERPISRLDAARMSAFVELHIEQGPVLEASGVPIGVVSGVAGIARWDIEFTGRDDHAGTTPMPARRDAGAAMVSLLHGLEEEGDPGFAGTILWTCGLMQLKPGSSNVVPGNARCTVEFRSTDSHAIEQAGAILQRRAKSVGIERSVVVKCSLRSTVQPVEFDSHVRSVLWSAALNLGMPAIELPSGAGHDAMVIAPHIPTGMVFIPSIGGRSHSPAEMTDPEDAFCGVQVLARAVDVLTASPGVTD